MANKLTKDKLDLLIEQVLGEDFSKAEWEKLYHPTIKDMDFKDHPNAKDLAGDATTVSADPVFSNFKSRAKEDSKLGLNDIRYFLDNPEEIDTTIQSQLIAISRLGFGGNSNLFDEKYSPQAVKKIKEPRETASDEQKERYKRKIVAYNSRYKNKAIILKMAEMSEKALKNYETAQQNVLKRQQTITKPKITTAGSDVPIFNKVQVSAIKKALSGATSIEDATKKLSDISKLFYSAATGNPEAMNTIKNKPPQEVLNHIQVLELLATALKDYGAGESAYFMETLFAMLYGGAQAGKVKTSQNKDGHVDFTGTFGGKTEKGSAKMYSTLSGISQSLIGFGDDAMALKLGEESTVTYICGIKKQDAAKQGTLSGGMSSAPEKIVLIDMFVVKYIIKRTGPGSEDYDVVHDKDPEVSIYDDYVKRPSRVDVSKSIKNGHYSVYPVHLAAVRTKTFKEMIDSAIDEKLDGVGKAYEHFKKYYDSLKAASNNAKEYVNLGDTLEGQTKGQQVYVDLSDAEDNYTGLVSQLTYENKPVKENKKNNKKSLKDLDKLIEGVILNKINK